MDCTGKTVFVTGASRGIGEYTGDLRAQGVVRPKVDPT
jgi:NAD(P)-dependent dehydrogenase (short-subunit alcohol dehydrogenase family)